MLASPPMSRTSRFFRLTRNSPNCGSMPRKNALEISAEYIEKQSAKIPGRPIFNKLLNDIEKFGGNILAWHPDRLARNSVDGGRYFISSTQGNLRALNFQPFGVITLDKVNLCSIWLSDKANTM